MNPLKWMAVRRHNALDVLVIATGVVVMRNHYVAALAVVVVGALLSEGLSAHYGFHRTDEQEIGLRAVIASAAILMLTGLLMLVA